jgi:hypothetical protein
MLEATATNKALINCRVRFDNADYTQDNADDTVLWYEHGTNYFDMFSA